jgi:cytoskeletal protein RodZ
MESYGEYLKSLREERGLSLDEISESTKIATANLRFLEQDRYDLLPPTVFVKGFIRSYVEALGLDPEEHLRRFEDYTKQGEVPDYSGDDHPLFAQRSTVPDSFIKTRLFTVILTTAGFLSLVILVLTGISRLFFYDQAGGPGPTVTVAGPSNGSGASQGSRDLTGQEGSSLQAPAGRLTLEITAIANSWVRVQPDSGPARELLMTEGDMEVITADKKFFLQTGNAGALQIRLNGKEQRPIGRMNEAVATVLP